MPITPRHPILPFLRKVGAEVKNRRHQLDLTQEELALKAELSTTVVRRIEAGRQNFGMLTLFAIARQLNVSLVELFKASAQNP